ncbi:small subunit rRNA maturation protein UTP4 [Aspergillus luchuensis]|uniref:U3 small nucleolar RNA-associated protein n=1 Tax=Aspergillus kawachii TaxID=1069201 RepID=A0A7R7W0Z4_ASPKA|nr:U3 small nucleolar RNA-associated protein [Aspergillus luchuensis]BCR94378.1 U3 small nucleolar RNA-associated protein [Aspergillus luchuensis]BCS06981.1 U3 small nucleolar RNA-associated protein [Aspergillus luchuensis]GAA85473.1 small nucleolar ribonucleoprotein complex subunit [Aspergillus luchuensis IFO 4308]
MDIHRCRFVPYNPQAINALAFSHPPSAELAGRGVPTLRLAIGRANGDIEIWNPLRGAWFQETVLRGGKDRSIEGLAWTLDPPEPGPDGSKLPGRLRLFSIGYSTVVTEWDIEQGRPLRHSSGNYGEIWCLAAQPRWQATRGKDGKLLPPAEGEFTGQHLAAGCADGSIVILSTADNDLKYLRTMRPSTKRSRVLSVTFQNRNTLVAGYADSSIRLYDIRSGQLLRTISLGKGPAGGTKELLVWSVKCLPDGTIVSGDSAGEIRFWDAKNYALIQRLQGHLADTLDIAVSAKGDTVVSGGADQRTVVYRKKDGEKGDKKARWTEVMHRRYHTHDVKTFAVYETRDISIAVSGGPDAAPVVLPLREFGKEHHRKLSSLPQIPQLASSPASRLVMSFWDREVSIWRLHRGPATHENADGQRHRLVGKVLIQGEENITSAMLSADGKILVVATISTIKLFSVRRRKGDEKGTLRIQKLDVPKALAEDGARVVTVAPNGQWVCVVRPNSAMYLARIKPASTAQEKPHIHTQLVKLNRASRHTRFEKASHGTLGEYERSVRCVVFSDDSKVLASGDLSGCVDTWALQNAEDAPKKRDNAAGSDDESSDDEDQPVIDGERWTHAAGESPIPRLKSGVVLLSFRPPNPAKTKLLINGVAKDEHRLMALTSEHQLVEFDAVEGKLSDWSRRNPKAFLPEEFRGVKDRAMGCVWDLSAARERLWLYGTSWLWMFDLNQDFPSPEELNASADNHEDENASTQTSKKSAAQKRKRNPFEEEENARKKPNSGAGDRIPLAQSDLFFAAKMRKIVGSDEGQGEWMSLDKERPRAPDADDEAYDYDEAYTANNDVALARLRRERQFVETSTLLKRVSIGGKQDKLLLGGDVESPSAQKQLVPASADAKSNQQQQPSRRWWHTYKYRDLLGIVPLGSDADDVEGDSDSHFLEVAVVERPMWDVDLPGRYVRDYA